MAKVSGSNRKNGNGTHLASDAVRVRISQADAPAYSLEEALRIAMAISENYAMRPTRPLEVAAAVGMSPTSSSFRMLCGASVAYGLTEGSFSSPQIAPTALAGRILEPREEGATHQAKREAFLRPRIIREFLTQYDGKRLPRDESISLNVLGGMGVPRKGQKDARKQVFELIIRGARTLGLLQEIKGATYVNLSGLSASEMPAADGGNLDIEDGETTEPVLRTPVAKQTDEANGQVGRPLEKSETKKVFVTHGKNRTFIDPLKDLLTFGELEPVVSVERESVSQPVPDKVMSDMRSCAAAIIHVDAEMKLIDNEGNTHVILNPNVMMEIGAAMALYGRRFILLVRDGVNLPSNLQGLYEVRYQGDRLDGEATIRLLKAIKDIKNHPLPT